MKLAITQVIAGGWEHSVGIRPDGTVLAIGGNDAGQCNVKKWNNIAQVATGNKHTVGLRLDGTVIATGENDHGQCEVDIWYDIAQIAAGGKSTIGIKSDGTIVVTGENNKLFDRCDMGMWSNIVQVALDGNHAVGLSANRIVVDTANYSKVSTWRDVMQIAAGVYGTIGLKSDGTVVVGAISNHALHTYYAAAGWRDIIQIQARNTHLVGLRKNGTLLAAGNQHYGFDEQYCFNGWNIDNWQNIIQIAAGRFFTLGLKSDGTVLAVGHNYFGQCKVGKWHLSVPHELDYLMRSQRNNITPHQANIATTPKKSYHMQSINQSKFKGGTTMSRRLEDLVDIANPQQPHCATILLLDVSGSMSGEKISQLNEGLKAFKEDIEQDDLASKRVDLAIVTFDDTVQVTHDFSSIEDFDPPTLSTGGSTSMGDAILKAAEMIEERKQQYKQKGIDYYRPWIFMITDGEPTDIQPGDSKWSEVIKTVHDGEAKKKFMFFGVAVEPANTEILKQITPPNRQPVRLKQGRFRELFQWLSKSQTAVSSSKPGEQVALENPVAAGWGEISI